MPQTCAEQGLTCGLHDDGCGTPLDCGGCPAGDTCLPAGTCCTPTCDGVACGAGTNGCGGGCGCDAGAYCDASGTCKPLTATCSGVGECLGACGDDLDCVQACHDRSTPAAWSDFAAYSSCLETACPTHDVKCLAATTSPGGSCYADHEGCLCGQQCGSDALPPSPATYCDGQGSCAAGGVSCVAVVTCMFGGCMDPNPATLACVVSPELACNATASEDDWAVFETVFHCVEASGLAECVGGVTPECWQAAVDGPCSLQWEACVGP